MKVPDSGCVERHACMAKHTDRAERQLAAKDAQIAELKALLAKKRI